MAYIPPIPRSAGFLVTATRWTQDVVNNIIAMFAGAMGMTGQAAEQLVVTDSATQLKILTLGAGQSVRKNAGNTALEAFTPPQTSIVQIVTGSTATEQSTGSATYADTGLTATITPGSTANKVLVLAKIAGIQGNGTGVTLQLLRGATALQTDGNNTGGRGYNQNAAVNPTIAVPMIYLDAPASVAALTYKVQFASYNGAGTAKVQGDSLFTSYIMLIEYAP